MSDHYVCLFEHHLAEREIKVTKELKLDGCVYDQEDQARFIENRRSKQVEIPG